MPFVLKQSNLAICDQSERVFKQFKRVFGVAECFFFLKLKER
ncbi:hypothetical protein CHRYSEO8AT_150099 [Chryseobacterium sp. 8AT]|nr:hypothetical protein CHRYSEO8AT_150099 [Chryseobacterium sp. 8AT]